jgi:hypothetical protein
MEKIMNKFVKMIAIAPIIVLLSACGISAGTVSSKVVEPERQYSTVQMVGKVPVTTFHTDDEDYCFNIVNDEGSEGYVCVEKTEWDTITEGDFYNSDAE